MNTKRSVQYWVIPPKANSEFVAHMEDVLLDRGDQGILP